MFDTALVLFVLAGLLAIVGLCQPLALGVTENNVIPHDIQRFVAVLATGFVLFTLFVNGTTLLPSTPIFHTLERRGPRLCEGVRGKVGPGRECELGCAMLWLVIGINRIPL